MGDEGVGVHVIRQLQSFRLPEYVELLDGGTGGFVLLEAMQRARGIVLIDATIDGAPPGTVRRLTPKYSSDYPRTLTAHDIGLKDLLDVLYLSESQPEVVLYAVSIGELQDMTMELSAEVARMVPRIAERVVLEVGGSLDHDR